LRGAEQPATDSGMSDLSDDELLALFRKEDTRHYAFNLLMRKYQRRLYTFIRRMVCDHDEAEDVLQDTFIKVWQKLGDFRGDAQMYSWIYRIAHNQCLDHLRRLKRGLFVSHDAVSERLCGNLDSTEHFTGDHIQRQLQRAIMTLPDKQRAVFHMKYFDELKYEEISGITGTSVGALKSSYHIAVKKIEAWLTADQTKATDPTS
jgi:RNA polymerase sigma-70 factor (ECF subfamily)